MNKSLVVGLLAAFLASSLLAAVPVRGQVISTTVGIQPKCPYGLGACWPEAYDGLRLMAGVKSVNTRPSLETWTGTIRTKEGALPDPEAWSPSSSPSSAAPSAFGAWRSPSRATSSTTRDISPSSSPAPGPCSDSPLGRKVQWDPDKKCEQAATVAEKNAYQRLADRARRRQRAGPAESGLSAPWRGLHQIGRRSFQSATSPGAKTVPVRPGGLMSLPRRPRAT